MTKELFTFNKYVPSMTKELTPFDIFMVDLDVKLTLGNDRYVNFLSAVEDNPVSAVATGQASLERIAFSRLCWYIRRAFENKGGAQAVEEMRHLRNDRLKKLLRNDYRHNSSGMSFNLQQEINRAAACLFVEWATMHLNNLDANDA